jgi:hypothetical protein
MNLATAINHLSSCISQMETLYHAPVFDEWVVLAAGQGRPSLVHYHGPRAETVVKEMHSDSSRLYAEMSDRQYGIGDFEFVQTAEGQQFDAYVRLGERHYLLCNNTSRTMAELRADSRWRAAQKPFLDFTERFRNDPLT